MQAAWKHGYKNPLELIEAEYKKGKIAREIGEMLGVTTVAVTYRLKQLGIWKKQKQGNRPYINRLLKKLELKREKLGYESIDEMFKAEYRKLKNLKKTATRLGISPHYLRENLQKQRVLIPRYRGTTNDI